jgi:epoxyqueuosine reductase QueG
MAGNQEEYTKYIKSKIKELGASLVGVADTRHFNELPLDPPDLLSPFKRALSIAIRLPGAVFEQIIDRPTPIYGAVYKIANRTLDDIAFHTVGILQNDGFKGLLIPASQTVDRERWYGAISHKAVARMAGLGWLGKSLLLVNPVHGPRIRLSTVLTDAPLAADEPMENRCGDCMLCADACPVDAIKGVKTEDHYPSRDAALHFSRCVEKLVGEFSKLPNVGGAVCGICIKACPYGR